MRNTLIQVNQNGMGGQETKLSLLLIKKYFKLLTEEENPPAFIVFYNEGVKLLCEGSSSLVPLQELTQKGTKLIACSTCLEYFNISEKRKIGESGSMLDIIALQKKSSKIITL